MPLVNAKCTNCGAPLQVDNSHEAAVCPYCNSAYIVEKAIQNFNFSVTNNITAQNIIIAGKGEMEKERLLQNAQTNENFKEYDKALEIYGQVTEDYPDDYRGWYGMASIQSNYFKDVDIPAEKFKKIQSLMSKAIKCAPQSNQIRNELDKYSKNYYSFIESQKTTIKSLQNMIDTEEEKIKENNALLLRQKRKIISFSAPSIFLLSFVISISVGILLALILNSIIMFVFGLIFSIVLTIILIILRDKHNSKTKKITKQTEQKILEQEKEKKSLENKINKIHNKYSI